MRSRAQRITYQLAASFCQSPCTRCQGWHGCSFGTVLVFVVRSPGCRGGRSLAVLAFPWPGCNLSRLRARLFVTRPVVRAAAESSLFTKGDASADRPLAVTVGRAAAAAYCWPGRFSCHPAELPSLFLTYRANDLAYALMRAGVPYRTALP